jgi:hypothetical protein
MSTIGMMDPAFFVGKNELLTWLNDLLDLNYSKVEQCASGAAYCQIMDAIYPVLATCSWLNGICRGSVSLHTHPAYMRSLPTRIAQMNIPAHPTVSGASMGCAHMSARSYIFAGLTFRHLARINAFLQSI